MLKKAHPVAGSVLLFPCGRRKSGNSRSNKGNTLGLFYYN